MYCAGALSLTEMIRMRACRPASPPLLVDVLATGAGPTVLPAVMAVPVVVAAWAAVAEALNERAVLLMWARARVRAPDIWGVVVERSVSVVSSIKARSEVRRDFSIWANCGYLFADEALDVVPGPGPGPASCMETSREAPAVCFGGVG
ncbi:hypothetical protein VTH82DRAFT_8090 [Thermothelomyces myriococcoides]